MVILRIVRSLLEFIPQISEHNVFVIGKVVRAKDVVTEPSKWKSWWKSRFQNGESVEIVSVNVNIVA